MAMTPINFRGNESSTQLKTASPAFSQFVAPTVKRHLWTFMNYVEHDPDNQEGMGAGAPEFAEVSTSGIGAVLCGTSADAYDCIWFLPPEIALDQAIKFRVFWSESGTGGSGSALWAISYTQLVTETTAVAIGGTALSTVIAADTPSTTANCLQASEQGTLNANTLTAGGQGVNAVALDCACTLTTISDASAFALEVEYDRRFVG